MTGQNVPSASLLMTVNLWEESAAWPWCSRESCCHSEGTQWAGEMDWWKPCEVQQSKALDLDHLHAPIYAGRHLAGKQLCRKASEVIEDHYYIGSRRLWFPQSQQHALVAKKAGCYARVCWAEYCQQVEGTDPCPLLDAGETCLSSLSRSGLLSNLYKCLKGQSKEDRARFFSVVSSDSTRGNEPALTLGRFHVKHLFSHEGDRTLLQVAQRNCEICLLGGLQNPTGCDHRQLGLNGPAWAEGLNKITSRGPSQPQLLCDSVKELSRYFGQFII